MNSKQNMQMAQKQQNILKQQQHQQHQQKLNQLQMQQPASFSPPHILIQNQQPSIRGPDASGPGHEYGTSVQ